MTYSDAGSAFIFGSLVGPKMDRVFDGAGFVFAFRVLPAIIFITALVSLLYYIGVMGFLIRLLGGIFQKALNISKIESFVAVTTIFLGQNEIPAIVKPFMERLNRNELFTAICSGMVSIAGSTMIGYAALGVPIDYLLAASLMAIPGGILFARLLSPATEASQVSFENLSFTETPPKSVIEAAASGAMTGLKIAEMPLPKPEVVTIVEPESPLTFMKRPKRIRWENSNYLAWVKTQPCACCGQRADDPHHLIGWGQGGMATKAHDILVIPLCRIHHTELHNDPGKFERKYGAQPALIINLLDRAYALGVLA
jgi:hypothetical protein